MSSNCQNMMHDGKLADSMCYLIGPIEGAKDKGISWRSDIVEQCHQNDLQITFLDPTNKITGLQKEIDTENQRLKDLREEGRYDELSKEMKPIVREDHRSVDISDFLIVYIDPEVHTCGSYFELKDALDEKKPYFIIIKNGKKKTPLWLFGIVDHNSIFNNVDEVVKELQLLNSGDKEMSDRWVLMRRKIKQVQSGDA